MTVALSYAGGAAVPITRVVVNRLGGCTHSTHFDQRQARRQCNLPALTQPQRSIDKSPTLLRLPCQGCASSPYGVSAVGLHF